MNRLIDAQGADAPIAFLYCTAKDVSDLAADVDPAEALDVLMHDSALEEQQLEALQRVVSTLRADIDE